MLFEKSTREFHEASHAYIHRGATVFDTDLRLETLQEYVLVSLDIFQKNMDNKAIENKLEAWLMFISSDAPERIVQIMEAYPEFREAYEEIYELCRNVEGIMELFSKELRELDRNTVQYMIEELEEELKTVKEKLCIEKEKLRQGEEKVRQKEEKIRQGEEKIRQGEERIRQSEAMLQAEREKTRQAEQQAAEKDAVIAELQKKIRQFETATGE